MNWSSRSYRRSWRSARPAFHDAFIKIKESHRAKVLISRHRDGEFNAIAVERLGIGTIRGSGDHGSAFHRKGRCRRVQGDGARASRTATISHRRQTCRNARGSPPRHHHAGAGIRTADPAIRDGNQPLHSVEQLGPHHHQFAIRAGRSGWGLMRCIVPPDADGETMEKLRLQVGDLFERSDPSRLCAGRPSGRSAGRHRHNLAMTAFSDADLRIGATGRFVQIGLHLQAQLFHGLAISVGRHMHRINPHHCAPPEWQIDGGCGVPIVQPNEERLLPSRRQGSDRPDSRAQHDDAEAGDPRAFRHVCRRCDIVAVLERAHHLLEAPTPPCGETPTRDRRSRGWSRCQAVRRRWR